MVTACIRALDYERPGRPALSSTKCRHGCVKLRSVMHARIDHRCVHAAFESVSAVYVCTSLDLSGIALEIILASWSFSFRDAVVSSKKGAVVSSATKLCYSTFVYTCAIDTYF